MWDFIKNAIVDDVNAVPEQFRGLYVKDETSGKFKVADFAKGIVDAYSGTTSSLDKVRKDLAAANGEAASRRVTKNAVVEYAKSLGLEGIDEENPLASLQTHVEGLMGKIKGGSDLKINLENIKKDYETRNAALKAEAEKTVADMSSSLEKHLIGNAVLAALGKHGGNATLLTPLVRNSAKVVKDENGEYSVRVFDEQGNARSNGAGGWLDLDGFVAELKTKPEMAGAFASERKAGTGAVPGAHTQQVQRQAGQELTATEKIAAGLAKQRQERGAAAAAA